MPKPIRVDRRALLGWGGTALAFGSLPAAARPGLSPGPGHLNAHCGGWDSRRRAALVFGGASERRVVGDLWQLQNRRWSRLASDGPPPRTFAAAAYDSRRDRFVLFGGNRVLFGPESPGDTLLNDHWEWDGRRWHRFDGVRPSARTEAACLYDPRRGRVLMFGGWQWRDGQRVRLDELWEFDGRHWSRHTAAGPAPRSGCAGAFDAKRKSAAIVGGNGPRSEAWSFDGRNWTRLPDMPQGRFNPNLAYDAARQVPIIFGGWTGRERIAATCTMTGSMWRPFRGSEPPPRNHSLLVPFGDGTRLMLIGGHDGERIFADQWEWNGSWRLAYSEPPEARVENGH